MLNNSFILFILILCVACQTKGEGVSGGSVISGHTEVKNEFTLTTPDAVYRTGQTIPLTLNFPVNVTVTGNPKLEITLGASVVEAVFQSVSGKKILFHHVIQAGETDTDGISVKATLVLNGATVKFNGTEECSSQIRVPDLSGVVVNVPGGLPPVTANMTAASFNEDSSSTITLSYTDFENDPATSCQVAGAFKVTTGPCACAAGVCTVTVSGISNQNGSGGFSFQVTASGRTSNTSVASFSLLPVADTPVASPVNATFSEDTISTITLAYTDADGDKATACSTSALSNITVTTPCACVSGVCKVSVRGTTHFNGAAGFSYTVTANGQVSSAASASLTVTPVNDAPVVSSFSPASFPSDTESIITLPYSDVENNPATTCSVTGEVNVTETQACECEDGECTVGVTGTSGYSGSASFQFTVSTGALTSNPGLAGFTITDVEDPAALGLIGDLATEVNTPTSAIEFEFTDPDGAVCDSSRLTMTSSNPSLVPDGAVVFSGTAPDCTAVITPAAESAGTTTITITATDGGLPDQTTSFTLDVNGAVLIWVDENETPLTSFDFGNLGNASMTFGIKNVGNADSSAVDIISPDSSVRIGTGSTCGTIAADTVCPVQIDWSNSGGGSTGLNTETFTAQELKSSSTVTVTGTK